MKLSFLSILAVLGTAAAAPVTPHEPADKRIFYNPTTDGAYSALSASQYSAWSSSARWAA